MRWSHLKTLATALTLSRLGIATVVSVLPFRYLLPLYLIALLTDVLDGWVARRTHTCSEAGAVLDGWVDKILHVNLAWTLAVQDRIPDIWMILWFTREILQAPMVPVLTRRFRLAEGRTPQTNPAGRLTAILLAFAMTWSLLGRDATVLSWMIALSGLISALGYARRHLWPMVAVPHNKQ